MPHSAIPLGDPVPWFAARTMSGGAADLHVAAGRWVVLAFFDEMDSPRARDELARLAARLAGTTDDHLVAYCLLGRPPADPVTLDMLAAQAPTLRFICDFERHIALRYGAAAAPRSYVLDPMLRAIADIPWDHPSGHAALLEELLGGLPSVDQSAGVPLAAPALIVPRVLDFALCDFLVRLYDKMGGEDSGFLLDNDGKTGTVLDYRVKRRRDLLIVVPELRERIRQQLVRRLLPAIERYFQFSATRMDRYMVSCYDSSEGGHFFRHRDNVNVGAQHRRFAVSINLTGDYDGCDLLFPEFGRRPYRAPVAGAVVFSCGALHEVTPIAKGKRYAFLPFLYGEEDAAKRTANNAHIAGGSARYREGDDRLYPLAEAAE